ncbi:Os12g0488600 [Oryza sativa Japonica Group]|uniref:Os12g0488600 protein n=1 Tax=Oryza sativa subsp. japonica TaxID=39947 RepID=A0A0P0YA90_ORYSJ|nr:Os12g0488600 [Oryza sativa Japonica Group]
MCGSAVRYVIGRVGVPPIHLRRDSSSARRWSSPPPSPTTSGRLFRSPRSSPPMRALPRGAAASLLRAAAAAAPCRPRPVQLQRRLPDADRLLAMNIPAVCFSRYSTLVTPSDEVLVPPELLSSRTVGTPERKIGQYEDLVARITNFTMRIRATWCWMVMYLMFQSGRTLFIELYVGNLLNGNRFIVYIIFTVYYAFI